jgi:hypothetical protein
MSDSSDFDIFRMPSRKLMTRVAGPWIMGSGKGKKPPLWPRSAIRFLKS